ncbi:MAG: hypothetical protein JW967_01630 [Dehalococcoidales bacterium]|nr:hypothetical protein [Dehalococcoidales bacterium]
MNIIRVFPRKTSLTPVDDMAFVGDPPMFRPAADEIHVSCTFTWDKAESERLARAWGQFYPVKIGGPAFETPYTMFIPGMYIRPGVIFTSYGCNNHCPWCLAWRREGHLRELPIYPGNLINDNNLLQCNKSHIADVFIMLRGQKQIEFIGGLDCREMTTEIADEIRSLRVYQMFFACDTKADLKYLQKVGQMFPNTDRRKLRCYVLLGFNKQRLDAAIEHMENVWAAGFMPHAQLYQPPDRWIEYPKEWRELSRRWIRPAVMQVMNGKDKRLPHNGGI